MVRVKLTGEVTEVDREVMKSLRAEEKKLRRSYGTVGTSDDENGEEKSSDTVLSLDALPEDDVKSSALVGLQHFLQYLQSHLQVQVLHREPLLNKAE